jgi:DNA-binding CsgD family transcriptional regulator
MEHLRSLTGPFDLTSLGATVPPVERDPMVSEINRFAQRSLHSSAAIFYWVEDGLAGCDAGVCGLPPTLWGEYLAEMVRHDPLSVPALLSAGSNMARLPGCGAGPETPRVYQEFLARHRVQDVIDMLFYADGEVIAGLGVIKLEGDSPLSPATIDLAEAMRPLIEATLHHHERVRCALRRKRLASVYGLTSREVEVAELVSNGCSNDAVADCLSIRLPTVKSHLLSIFCKTGSASRTELARLVYG